MPRRPRDTDILIPRTPEPPEMEQSLKNSEEILGNISSSISDIKRKLVGEKEGDKTEQHIEQIQEEIQEEQENIHPVIRMLTDNLINPIKTRYDKIRRKLVDKYHTIFVKGKFFEKVRDTFKKIIGSLTGTWLTKLFGAILALAIFDPKGKILGKIIGYLVNAVTWVLNAIANYIPTLVKNIIHIITGVLPITIKKLLEGVFKALYGMFDIWMKEFPRESIMYKILNFIQNIFAKNSPLLGFLKIIANLTPYIIAGLIALKAYTVAMTLFNVIMAMNPIVAVILAVTALWIALWTFRDKIAGWFESLFSWFKRLGTGFKILGIIIAALLAPITIAGLAIYGLVKLFQSFAKIGVTKTFQLMWKNITKFFKVVWKDVTKFFKVVWKNIKKFFDSIWRVLKKIPSIMLKVLSEPLFGLPKLIIRLLKKGFGWLVSIHKKFKNFFNNLFEPIKNFFSEIIIWFKTISNVGLLNYLTKGAKYRERATQLTRMVESVKETEKLIGYTPKKLAEISAAGTSQKQFEKMLKVLAENSDKEVKVRIESIQKIEENLKARFDSTRSTISPKTIKSITGMGRD